MNYKGAVCALALVAAFSIGCTAKSANQAAEQGH